MNRGTLTMKTWLPVVVVMLVGTSAWADEVDELFGQLFGAQLREVQATRVATDDVELAGRMVDAADKLKETPLLRQRLLTEGYDLAMKDRTGYATAITAANAMMMATPKERGHWEDKLIDVYTTAWRTAPRDERAGAQQTLVDQLLSVAKTRENREDYSGAVALYRQALGVVPRRSDQRQEILERQRTATTRMQLQAKANDLAEKLKRNRDDTEAAKELVKLYVVDFNDPGKAKRYAKSSGDEQLAERVENATKPVYKLGADAAFDLGEWYGELADTADGACKTDMQHRSRNAYQRFVSAAGDKGVQAIKAKLKIAELDKALTEATASTSSSSDTDTGPVTPGKDLGATVDMLKLVDPEKDGLDGGWMMRNGMLANVKKEYGCELRFPVEVNGDYEMSITFKTEKVTRSYHTISLRLPIDEKRMTYFTMGGYYYAPRLGVAPDARTVATQIPANKWVTLTVRKETDRDGTIKIGVAAGSRKIIAWQGSPLAAEKYYTWPQRPGIELNSCNAIIGKASIKRLSGTLNAADRSKPRYYYNHND
jgi:hypothetical protein